MVNKNQQSCHDIVSSSSNNSSSLNQRNVEVLGPSNGSHVLGGSRTPLLPQRNFSPSILPNAYA